VVPVASFRGFWTLKGIAQESWAFSSHGAKFGICGQKNGPRGIFYFLLLLSPEY